MKFFKLLIIAVSFVAFYGCSNDESSSDQLQSKVFQLRYVENPSLLGKVIINENSDGSSLVTLELNGTSTEIHPAYIYYNSSSEGGEIAITLDPCGCVESNTIVSKLDNGTAITYEELINFNGHVKIHNTFSDIGTILLQGEIGANARNVY